MSKGGQVICELCGRAFKCVSTTHLRHVHQISPKEYRQQFPNAEFASEQLKVLRSYNSHTIKRKKYRPCSALAQQKKSDSMKRFYATAEGKILRERKRDIRLGKKRPEYAEKMKQWWGTPAGRAVIEQNVMRQRGKKNTPDTIAKRVASLQKAKEEGRYWNSLYNGLKARPNKFEKIIGELLPETFVYTGDFNPKGIFKFYNGQNKNSDFTLLPVRNVVVECFGTYWHSPKFEVLLPEQHTLDTVSKYAEIGVTCLVIWEEELKDMVKLKQKISQFLLAALADHGPSEVLNVNRLEESNYVH